jgi:hypothetical protein
MWLTPEVGVVLTSLLSALKRGYLRYDKQSLMGRGGLTVLVPRLPARSVPDL